MPIVVPVLKLVVALLAEGLAWYALAHGYNFRFKLLWFLSFSASKPKARDGTDRAGGLGRRRSKGAAAVPRCRRFSGSRGGSSTAPDGGGHNL